MTTSSDSSPGVPASSTTVSVAPEGKTPAPVFETTPLKSTTKNFSVGSPSSANLTTSHSFSTEIPQTGKSPSTKSLRVAVNFLEERDSAIKLLKQGVLPSSWVRLTPPSKRLSNGNIPGIPLFGVYDQGEISSTSLVIAQANPPPPAHTTPLKTLLRLFATSAPNGSHLTTLISGDWLVPWG